MRHSLPLNAALLWLAAATPLPLSAQPTDFSYQGELLDEGLPAEGNFDLQFSLFDSFNNGTQAGPTVTATNVAVVGGLFQVTLDFGADVWDGTGRFLEVGVRPGGSGEPFQLLSPRQRVHSVPYAIRADTASSVPDNSITGPMLADAAVTGSKLAQGSAAANLADSGLSGVASGGIVMSELPFATNLLEQGYARLGKLDLITESWRTLTNGPLLADFAALARREFAAVWTGTEMIIWGGGTDESGPLNTGGRYNPATDTWRRMSTNNAPDPQLSPKAVWTGTHMIVWGTQGPVRGGRYDPLADTWLSMSEAGAPEPRFNYPVVWTGTYLIVWGGRNASSTTATGARYNPVTDQWSPVSGSGAPAARDYHTALWTGSRMLVWGGRLSASCGFLCTRVTNYNDGFLYNPANNSWAPISTVNAPLRRFDHTAVWTGAEMIVWGGSHGQGEGAGVLSTNVQTGARYNLAANTWTSMTTGGAPEPRVHHAAHWTGSEMLIYGGDSGQEFPFGNGFLYHPNGNFWTPINPVNAPPTRSDHQTAWTGTELLVWGGVEVNEFGTFDDQLVEIGRRYNLARDDWTLMAASGEPSARRAQTAVWAETEMVVWGGNGGEFSLRTGGRLTPSASPDSMWTSTSLTNVPAARQGHTAVWTGQEMIVWGGSDTVNELNDGGRYRTVDNAWTPINTENAPDARQLHNAVWTGDTMLVWGGFGGSSYFNTGAAYTPSTDSWQPLPTLDAPSARARAAAVWTGREMIIWGGEVISPGPTTVHLDSGARFDPAAGTWRPVSQANAPDGRSGHTAVWTGAEMIIWGGETDSGLTDTGGRYDPSTDTWRPLPLANAPVPRSLHTAVWAGTQMLVWGGNDGERSISSGGRFNPVSNIWTPITTVGAPALRQEHTAVWSGTEMIVWAGITDVGSTFFLNDDAYAYSPARTVFLYLKP